MSYCSNVREDASCRPTALTIGLDIISLRQHRIRCRAKYCPAGNGIGRRRTHVKPILYVALHRINHRRGGKSIGLLDLCIRPTTMFSHIHTHTHTLTHVHAYTQLNVILDALAHIDMYNFVHICVYNSTYIGVCSYDTYYIQMSLYMCLYIYANCACMFCISVSICVHVCL